MFLLFKNNNYIIKTNIIHVITIKKKIMSGSSTMTLILLQITSVTLVK
jgi:hypothetical protein